MKIRHPVAIKAASFLAAIFIRLWMGFCTFRYRPLGPDLHPHRGMKRKHIFVFYHEYILALPVYTAHRKISVLISNHADGEIIAQAIQHLGFSTVRGSTTRGGAAALRAMRRLSKTNHISVIPDGPRGPRRKIEAGLPYLASMTGMPIVLLGIAYEDCWRFNTWDKFALPKFGTTVYVLTREAIEVPPRLSREELDAWQVKIDDEMRSVTEEAERRAVDAHERQRGWFWWLRGK